ncbi:MAG TPA: hypothetical protein VGU70_23280 [Methylobacterium sp.]|jgi:hypothetical protein|uniref:hypothetical protein n=1 Tax=Methylorubrum sp. B1-46 TaxID=2897334 RepID=UPI001E63186C|nr:hypothetical protein [Methylorubrum sp. B1-46]UGB24187.1 hypothetical protein LPC10_14555 [Methylorubrum sp. B1-46]HEV2545678.1 hypothetical protein [Methylobacterium sp.]
MRSVPGTDNVIPFRRPAAARQGAIASEFGAVAAPRSRSRADQRSLMDAVYATGSLRVAAGDRETKLIASRLQVYGFLTIEEMGEDGSLRRLRPSEAIRARSERPWRLSKAGYGSGLAVTIPSVDDFLFEPAGLPA